MTTKVLEIPRNRLKKLVLNEFRRLPKSTVTGLNLSIDANSVVIELMYPTLAELQNRPRRRKEERKFRRRVCQLLRSLADQGLLQRQVEQRIWDTRYTTWAWPESEP